MFKKVINFAVVNHSVMKKVYLFLFLACLALGVYAALERYGAKEDSVSEDNDSGNVIGMVSQQRDGVGSGVMLAHVQKGQREQVIEHSGYTVSWNADWNIPNWVSYELTPAETDGEENRKGSFEPDPLVVGDRIVHKDYKNDLGYDRGHMAPAADMKWSELAMEESFYTSNICPQNHNLNCGDWKKLEEQVRLYATDYDGVWVVTGPIVKSTDNTLGNERKIVIPEAFYKVILVRFEGEYHGIGFIMKNCPKEGKWGLEHYVVTIDEAEMASGIDFFYQLDDSIEKRIEGNVDLNFWTF